jgi:spermidine synthase
MHRLLAGLIYFLFFLSGAAALVYQVVWVRSLGLIFGGSHLAVTTVLSTFMAGLALGGYLFGRYADRTARPLRLYGLLEVGIAVSVVGFVGLMKLYPSIYIPLARGIDNTDFTLSLLRVSFAVVALIVPTTLMGGTLPVLSRFVMRSSWRIGRQLSLLYSFNTLGAVAGTAAAAFVLLRVCSLSGTLAIAIVVNLAIGLLCLFIDRRAAASVAAGGGSAAQGQEHSSQTVESEPPPLGKWVLRLVLWGVGVSGFCALGYEVLWTRILTLAIGASVYGFATMLIAFLAGIAIGSQVYGLSQRLRWGGLRKPRHAVIWFGIVQLLIGLSALYVTFHLRNLPVHSLNLLDTLQGWGLKMFQARQLGNFILAFAYMLVPAFFMGVAFPLAGRIYAEGKRALGSAIGDVLTWNTVGAICGAAVSGYLLLFLFGIERSLQMLIVINLGLGLLVLASLSGRRWLNAGSVALALGMLSFLAIDQEALRMWDRKYFAVFRNNQPDAFRTPQMIREALANTDVLFYHEGIEATTSAIRTVGGSQGLLVNGKTVASNHLQDQQCQYTLGHLPMLLHPDPRKVFVLGLGTGMTLGAVSVHPQLEELTLAEIEPKVSGAARTFAAYNHNVLDNPKLRIAVNDGRNFLLTTPDRYDVITADPIHPWAQGASYLYTREYFRLAADRLAPGGIMCQWLPIYELSVADLQSVVRTFGEQFRYTMLWLTYYDAEIIGSNQPIVIDEAQLEQRIRSVPTVQGDLERVYMGSSVDFLSWFVMATPGMQAFSRDGVVNTDDNLYLEFSAPLSIAVNRTVDNVLALGAYREPLLSYLAAPVDPTARLVQQQRWVARHAAAQSFNAAHAMALGGQFEAPRFQMALTDLQNRAPDYAPGRFLAEYAQGMLSSQPRLLQQRSFTVADRQNFPVAMEVAAVVSRMNPEMALVDVVDSRAREVFGQLRVAGRDRDPFVATAVLRLMAEIETVYSLEAQAARARGENFPSAERMRERVETLVRRWIAANGGGV